MIQLGRVSAQARRAGATSALVAGATLAALQIAQNSIGPFNPRPAITLLITVTVGLATLVTQRLRVRKERSDSHLERERLLEGALRCWPLPKLSHVDPTRLGIFPARRDAGRRATPYVRRSVDDRLEEAVASSPFVLVVGPPRSGKSRTLFETASEALADPPLIIPKHREGLEQLLDLDPPPWSGRPNAVLWLDGLERYLESLDANALDRLDADSVKLLGTIRADDYAAALAASGDPGEAAKAVAACARVFELPAELDEAEQRAGTKLYGDEDFSGGLGARLSTSGTEEIRPPSALEREEPEQRPAPDPPAGHDPLLVAPALGCVLALLAIGLVVETAGFSEPEPPSLAERVDAVKLEAAGSDRSVVTSEVLDFHGSGEPSYLFDFQTRDFEERESGSSPAESDELRIYDLRGGDPVERFRFQPDVPGARFQIRYSGDLDGDGDEEVIGGYGFQSEASLALLPFLIYWDAASGDYRIASLQTDPPVDRAAAKTTAAGALVDAYRKQLVLRDADAGESLTGYRVQDFGITTDPPRLVSGVAVQPATSSIDGQVEVKGSILGLAHPEPRVTACEFDDPQPLFATWDTDRRLYTQILEAWKPYVENRVCGPS